MGSTILRGVQTTGIPRGASPGGISEGYVKLMSPGSGRAAMHVAKGAPAPGTPGGATTTMYDSAQSMMSKVQQRRGVSAGAAFRGAGFEAEACSGRIEVIFGPMFAGKTTELLRRCQVAESAGRNVMMIKSSSDTRYAAAEAVTHDGARRVRTPSQY